MSNQQLRLIPHDSADDIQELPTNFLDDELAQAGDPVKIDDLPEDAIGFTMFDTLQSKDNTVTILLPPERIGLAPSQSLVRIKSKTEEKGGDGRQYLGAVIEGPFAEPNGLRATSNIIVTTTVKGAMFMPSYHGRVQVQILGEEDDGVLVPPRFRPLPNSPVFALSQEETTEKLNLMGDVPLGLAVGYEDMTVNLPTDRKDVFPRHLGVLGTTGGGKSTTVSRLIGKLSKSGVAVIVFDTEGEYTTITEPTRDNTMLKLLERRKLKPEGVHKVNIYHLIDRETTNPDYTNTKSFCLQFSNLSPHAVIEILDLNEAQEERFLKAFDLAKNILKQLKIYPNTDEEEIESLEIDEMETGYPHLTLDVLYDVVQACAHKVGKESGMPYIKTKEFYIQKERFMRIINEENNLPGHVGSWRKVQGRLGWLRRLGIFDNSKTSLPDYDQMTQSGQVTLIDLSDTDSPQINNLVIAEILRGLRLQQDENYKSSQLAKEPLRKVVIVIEEAHEFLSSNRIKQMPVLFQQVARIARRGRKRWLGLIFVTQLPQHLPNEVLGLINNYILHKVADSNVINRLKNSIGGVDDGLWNRLPNLAAGQAIVVAESLARPLLVAIDPTPHQLRMTE